MKQNDPFKNSLKLMAILCVCLFINGILFLQNAQRFRNTQYATLYNEIEELTQLNQPDTTKPWILMKLDEIKHNPNETKLRYITIKHIMRHYSDVQCIDLDTTPVSSIQKNTNNTKTPLIFVEHHQNKTSIAPISYRIKKHNKSKSYNNNMIDQLNSNDLKINIGDKEVNTKMPLDNIQLINQNLSNNEHTFNIANTYIILGSLSGIITIILYIYRLEKRKST